MQGIALAIMISVLSVFNKQPYTEQEQILLRITEAEATDGTLEQKLNVISCVMNRVESKDFPNTVKGVVFEKGQFTPISDGRYYSVSIQPSTEDALLVWKALPKSTRHNCLFFCTTTCGSYRHGWFSTLEESFQDGMHAYFTGEKKK